MWALAIGLGFGVLAPIAGSIARRIGVRALNSLGFLKHGDACRVCGVPAHHLCLECAIDDEWFPVCMGSSCNTEHRKDHKKPIPFRGGNHG